MGQAMSKRKDIESIHYLSPLQEGLLFHAVSDAAADPYFTQTGFVIDGELKLDPFEQAWQTVMERHPILRTGFVWDGVKQPMQVARLGVRIPLQILDWRALLGRQRDEALEVLLREDRRKPFDLLTPPMMRLTLIRIEDSRWYFINSHHHILLDGWSVALLLREVLTCYDALTHGRQPGLPPVRPYAEYLTWLRSRNLDTAENFWRTNLSGFSTPTALPLETPQCPASEELKSLPYAEQEVRLSKAEVETLTVAAKRRRLTLNTLAQGAWSVLLHRCTGDREVLFGATVSGRPAELPGSDVMVGLFINTLPVRVSIPSDAKLGDWLGSLQEQNSLLRQYEWTPLSRIRRWSGVPGGRPLFDSIVVFESYPEEESDTDQLGLRIAPMASQRQEAEYVLTAGRNNYPLSLMVEPAAEMRLILSYARERFAHEDITRLLGYYRTLLMAMAERPDVRLAELSPLNEAERDRLLTDWNRTMVLVDGTCVHERIERLARKRPEATAVVYEERSLTYGELDARADRLARYLQKCGVGPDARVGLCVERSLDLIVGLLGVLKAGGAYVALDPKLPKERLAYMLSDSGARVVLMQAASGDLFQDSDIRQVYLDRDWENISSGGDQPLRRDVRPENLAYVIYTSGSTGRPKGVAVEHRQVVNYVSGLLSRLPLEQATNFATVSTVAADLGNTSIFGSLCSGRALHVLSVERGFDPDAVAEYMAGHRIDVLKIVPSHLAGLLEAGRPEQVLPRRCLILGGEAAHGGLVERIRALAPGCEIINHYGPTETTIGALTHRIDQEADRQGPIPIGRPLANSQVFILDSDGQPTPVGVSGELYVGGDGLARGYLDRPDLTAERFVPNPFGERAGGRLYRTGDRARYRPDGAIEFHGRMDNQVKVRGFRIELGEIEAQLRADGRLKDAAVVVRAAADGAKQLAAYVVAPADLDPDSVRSSLAVHLPDYMIPSTVTVLEALPLTANGKIDRTALPDPEQAQTPQSTAYVAPRNEVETMLAQIWADVLHLDRVGIHDNFFTIGGDSIRSLQVVARAHKSGIKLTPKHLFEHPTVAETAAVAATALAESAPDFATQDFSLSGLDPAEIDRLFPDRSAVEDLYPLTPMQEGMLFHTLLNPGTGIYLMQQHYTWNGPLNLERLVEAWGRVIGRHPILRTAYIWKDLKRPLQVVQRRIDLAEAVHVLDWRGSSAAEQKDRLVHALEKELTDGFDMSRAPLMRIRLIRTGEESYHIVRSFHHILTDDWCFSILMMEVLSYYEAFLEGRSIDLPTPRPYRDYIAWLQRQDLGAAEVFWRKELEGFSAPTSLGVERLSAPRQEDVSEVGDEFGELSEPVTERLTALAQQQGLTLNTFLQGAWALLLSRYSGTHDVVMGVTVAGRPTELEGVESIVGLFINSLPLRVRIASDARLLEWLKGILADNYRVRQYEYPPLVQIQRWSEIPKGQALFKSLVVFENAPVDPRLGEQVGEVSLEFDHDRVHTNYPVTVVAYPGPRLGMRLSYDRRLFEPEAVRRMVGHLSHLLEAMATRPEARLCDLSLLSAEERAQLLVEWNRTAAERPEEKGFAELFEAQVRRTPDAVAAIDDERRITYHDLNRAANRVAHALRRRGVGPDGIVALLHTRGIDLLIMILGVLKAGGAYLPLDPHHPPARTAQILATSRPALLLTVRAHAALAEAAVAAAPESATQRMLLDFSVKETGPDDNPPRRGTSANLAYVIFTSGSTGVPKGAMVEERGMVNHLLSKIPALGLSGSDVIAQTASQCFDISVWQFLTGLLCGACTRILLDDLVRDPQRLLREIERSRITVWETVPSLLVSGLDGRVVPLSSLRWLLATGEAVTPELCRVWFSRYPSIPLMNAYGPAECSDDVAVHAVTKAPPDGATHVPIGRPIPHLRLYGLDGNGEPVPVDVAGELYIGGVGVGRGYLNDPVKTASVFVPDPFATEPGLRLYRSGDLVRFRSDGTLEFLGRRDHQVKVRGYRIELGEIEARLVQHSQVREAVVAVREDRPGNKRLIAYVVNESSVRDAAVIRSFTAETLPDYMVPAVVIFLDALPLTPNGKIDRKALPAPDDGEPLTQSGTPRTAVEEILAGIWAEILGVKQVGVHDNFFELGGHSLLATQVVSRIRTSFQIELPLRSLFEAPTVEGLSSVIVQARSGPDETPLVRPALDERHGPLALSFAQQRLWFLSRMEPEGWSYNLPFALRLSGALDVDALSHSFEQVIARHETLRTTFREVEGEPVQVIGSAGEFVLPLDDLNGLPDNRRDEAVREAASVEVRRPFRLDQDRPIRARLLRLAEREHVLLVTLHHIAADAWSMTLLAHEVAVFYQARVGQMADTTEALPSLPVQYADFARWQRQLLQGPVLNGHLAYWKQRLGVNPPILKLPTDRPRPAVQTFRGARHVFTVPAEHADRLRALSRKQGVTLFMTLLAAFNAFLFRTTGQEDILIGTDVANRNREESEGLVGFFVNLLPLRSDLGGNPTFLELLAQARRTALEAYAHQDLPFEKIVEALKLKRDLGGNPLVHALLVLQNVPPPSMELPGLEVGALEFESEVARFDLGLFMEDADEGLTGLWKYSTDLFDASTIALLSERFVTLLGSVAAGPETKLSAIEIQSRAEKESAMIESKQREESKFKRFKNIQPKAVSLAQRTLVERRYLESDQPLPLVLQPTVEDVDLAAWAQDNRQKVEQELLAHGAILFRGFPLKGAEDFEQVAQALCPTLFGEYGDLPREKAGRRLYGSTPYPADRSILFHNESSHLHRWPLKQSFFCVQAAQEGGETPIVDCRKMCERLRPELREKFQERALMYVRNFTPGFDVSWQDFFHTEDQAAVEETCRQHGVEWEWTSDGGMRTRQACPAIIKHPKTGDLVFFNQIQLHHISYLEPAVRNSLIEVLGIERVPRNVYFGDGSPIDDETAAEIGELYERTSVRFPWRNGDLLMLDNMLVAHARLPFVGPRKIVVAMGEMVNQRDVQMVNV
ncbi:non-ribosomal peptide synthetase [Candidatus Nitrospira nitrificans]|uniref:Putative Multi-domain non-ribosomal peptide synthetase n=1 Tax=Candidatus Nitrospira nitrificans TaxID=1742973 RepID=A0A0S4LNL8_9BACT|nr:non-ribosomal peptide synthetase [Candidatus Nitrospira nitrificans]CUS39185.1 putative Multi-domain non-ribosomal peptide synthetase [Candidatus Nitrospira nitrificans]